MQTDGACRWLTEALRATRLVCLLTLTLLSAGCEKTAQRNTEEAADRLFSKKLECGKLLAHVEDSLLATTKGSIAQPLDPLVFYSPTLNTCVLREKHVLLPKNAEAAGMYLIDVEDLLTGERLEALTFQVSVSEQAGGEAAFEKDLMERYGAQPDQTPPARNEQPKQNPFRSKQ